MAFLIGGVMDGRTFAEENDGMVYVPTLNDPDMRDAVIAVRLKDISRHIDTVLKAEDAADAAAEQAGGVDIVSKNKDIAGDVTQTVKYKLTGRVATRIWSREMLENMTNDERAKVLKG